MRKLIVFGTLLALAAALMGCKKVEKRSDRESRSFEEARKLIACVDAALMSYNMKHGGKYPDSLNALTDKSDPLLEGDLVDPWGHELKYEKQGKKRPMIRSAGPDGEFGTEDDLMNYNPF